MAWASCARALRRRSSKHSRRGSTISPPIKSNRLGAAAMTKPTVSRIERKIEQLEAAHSGPRTPRYLRNWRAGRVLQTIVHEGSDEAETEKRTLEAQEKALAEHIAAHPEHAGSTVKDFFWIVREIVHVKRREDGTTVLSEPLTIDVGDTDDTGG